LLDTFLVVVRLRVVLVVLASVLVATCASDESDETGGADTTTTSRAAIAPSETSSSVVATSVVDRVEAFATPDASEPAHVLEHPTVNGGPLVFLVERQEADWLEVLLPVRPNGTTGWIRRADVSLTTNPYAIRIDLDTHRLVVTEGDQTILDVPVGIGTTDTPTPGGRYYLTELLEPPDPNGPYGTYAYGISGFSDVLESFGGGEGVVGIHGTNQPELVGQDVSHGCIRMTNESIERLVPVLPLGTPVEITA